jgi:hypothetical protein
MAHELLVCELRGWEDSVAGYSEMAKTSRNKKAWNAPALDQFGMTHALDRRHGGKGTQATAVVQPNEPSETRSSANPRARLLVGID